jgi:acetylornithine deacetylase
MNPSEATLERLRRLIAFDSTSRNSNLDLIDWAHAELQAAGARTRTSFNAERSKANLFATFGEGPGGLVLSGHTDVVPVDGQDWASDPFEADIRGENLYGRGACDMKGFVAAAMTRAPAMAAHARGPIHVALSYDEELGCLGIGTMLADIAQAGIRPAACIVGEPTSMRVVSAHKGGRLYRCRVCGKAAHSSLAPRAVNAIEYGARIATFVQDIAEEFRTQGPFDHAFDVAHSTISTNIVSGGTGSNIIPALCELMFEHRFLPGSDPEMPLRRIEEYVRRELLPRMHAIDPATSITFECIGGIPALAGEDSDILRTVQQVLGDNAPQKVAYGTEASQFQQAGIPAIVCGPGSIEHAHKADEFVPLAELARCEQFLDRMAERV